MASTAQTTRLPSTNELEQEVLAIQARTDITKAQKENLILIAQGAYHQSALKGIIEKVGYDFVPPSLIRSTEDSITVIPDYLISSKENVLRLG